MCGIVAILSRPSLRPPPAPAEVLAHLDRAIEAATGSGEAVAGLSRAAAEAGQADALLRGVPGLQAMLDHPALIADVEARLDALDAHTAEAEARLEAVAGAGPDDVERANAAVVAARDVLWALRHDRLRTGREVAAVSPEGPAAAAAWWAIQAALSSLDRLEVRGRDSAGLHLFVWGHGLDLDDGPVRTLIDQRAADPLFTSGAVRVADGVLSFVVKAAAEIGDLGDNTRSLRATMAGDGLLRMALAAPDARVAVLAHTRWASVGIISEPNAHPLNSEEETGRTGPYVVAALNGDVDNHADLRSAAGLRIPAPITTDAKVIPTLVAREADRAGDLAEAFRRTVAAFDGSVAVAAASSVDPGAVLLAQRGSGQALYVGLAEDAYVVASEPYGVVEETRTYLRLDGERPVRSDDPASRGQVVVLDGAGAGTLDGIRRLAYDGTDLPVSADDLVRAEVTTRDIDRGEHPHFFLKEISESPTSFRKTLRGKIAEVDGVLRPALGRRNLPDEVVAGLARGRIRRVVVIGQGTAAVAGEATAELLDRLTAGTGLLVEAMTATELSGFGLGADMSDTVVVAVSQSGTTTDTNRTVDLAKERGAWVVAIVNRRNSDLTDKAHGLLYTSDGRDVEMSVASTKAFYAQVAAGAVLACAIAEAVGAGDARSRHHLLSSLRSLPDAMEAVLARRPEIAEAARLVAPSRRHWAVVGNGLNRVAAEEVRIKLSELCYKSIACDVTENKKHIDLSSEPLIVVCAAGLTGSTADDVAKEVAIYRAHKAAPIVVATEGADGYQAALRVIPVPEVDPSLAFVLSTMAGHLFGYEAALAIADLARPLRIAREAIEAAARTHEADGVLGRLRAELEPLARRFDDGLRAGSFDGVLEASTAVRLASRLHAATSPHPLEVLQAELGKVATPAVLVDELTAALTRGIEELTRPVDAIKHQAKTVTVGISRSDEGLLAAPLVREVLAAGAARDAIGYRALKVLAELGPAVEAVTGFTRYRVDGDPTDDATIGVVDRGGISRSIPSRVDTNPQLRGTKRRVAVERRVLLSRGRADDRTVLLVPEVKGTTTTGITLLHVRLADRLAPGVAKAVLSGYGRYEELRDAVTETEPAMRDDLLGSIDVIDLLTAPVSDLADRWRS